MQPLIECYFMLILLTTTTKESSEDVGNLTCGLCLRRNLISDPCSFVQADPRNATMKANARSNETGIGQSW